MLCPATCADSAAAKGDVLASVASVAEALPPLPPTEALLFDAIHLVRQPGSALDSRNNRADDSAEDQKW